MIASDVFLTGAILMSQGLVLLFLICGAMGIIGLIFSLVFLIAGSFTE
jgi:hypothetical protein